MASILIVEDDASIRRTLERYFLSEGYAVTTASSLTEASASMNRQVPDVLLLDLMLPDGSGLSLLENRGAVRHPTTIIMTGQSELEYAAKAMRAGAFDFVRKPLDIDLLDELVQRAVKSSSDPPPLPHSEVDLEERLVGSSQAMLALQKAIGLASRTRASLLIQGESGTGKELTARAIHRLSTPGEPFIAVNCAAIVPTLLESELFGHERGSFTGADSRQTGLFELAAAGTILLDEIGEFPFALQSRLLRVVEEKLFTRVGGNRPMPLRARFIASTNRNLLKMVDEGTFRRDLFHRLAVVVVETPTLRSRRADIPETVEYLSKRIGRELGVHYKPEASVLKQLDEYDWPGNVRELRNYLLRMALKLESGESGGSGIQRGDVEGGMESLSLEEVEKRHILQVFKQRRGALGETCRILKISRPTLRKKLRDYGLDEASLTQGDEGG